LRDDRRSGSLTAPAAWFADTPNRQGQHPQAHMANLGGVLQGDAFAGGDRTDQASNDCVMKCIYERRRN